MTLTEFLTARLDEDEAVAREADARRHDPARVLADVESKRRIVAAHPEQVDMIPVSDGLGPVEYEVPGRRYIPEVLRLLALPHADHPDYDEGWRP